MSANDEWSFDAVSARKMVLARHAQPSVNASMPASSWTLSAEGVCATRALTERLRPLQPGRVITSTERKAIETGQIIAQALKIGQSCDELLDEQGRGSVPFIADPERFLSLVGDHFARPAAGVLGSESANDAADRLEAAVARHAGTADDASPILVTHGRILASYLARVGGSDACVLWTSLTMPDAFVVATDMPIQYRRLPG